MRCSLIKTPSRWLMSLIFLENVDNNNIDEAWKEIYFVNTWSDMCLLTVPILRRPMQLMKSKLRKIKNRLTYYIVKIFGVLVLMMGYWFSIILYR